MITTPERFNLPTMNGSKAKITIDPRGPLADVIALEVDGKKAIVPISALYKFMLTVVEPEKQEALVPVKTVRRRTFRKVVGLRIPKHLKPGEIYYVPVDMSFDLPDDAAPVSQYVKSI